MQNKKSKYSTERLRRRTSCKWTFSTSFDLNCVHLQILRLLIIPASLEATVESSHLTDSHTHTHTNTHSPTSHRLPSQPSGQKHLKELILSMQVPPFWHGDDAQSLMSAWRQNVQVSTPEFPGFSTRTSRFSNRTSRFSTRTSRFYFYVYVSNKQFNLFTLNWVKL